MAYEVPSFNLGVQQAAADLSTHQYKAVKVNNVGKIALCSVLGEFSIGILQDKPTQDQAANVAVHGVCKAMAGAGITAGQFVTPMASGKLQVAASTHRAMGVALETCTTDGQIIAVLLLPLGIIP